MIFYSPKTETISAIKQQLKKSLEITELGVPKFFLGIEISRNLTAKTVNLCQLGYINSILARFNFEDIIPSNSPVYASIALDKNPNQATDADIRRY